MDRNLNKIIKESIELEQDKITSKDRSKRVRDNDFGKIATISAEKIDIPVYAIFEYDNSGQLVYEDYTKLEEILEKEIIPNHIKEMNITDIKTNQKIITKTIQGNIITKMRLSEKEQEYAINYLFSRGILVRGIDSSLEGELNGYQYITTYKNEKLPEALSLIENYELFTEYTNLRNKIKELNDSKEKETLISKALQIREKIILGNLRLVQTLINKKIYNLSTMKDKEDIYQIGYEVLIYFVDTYDINKNASFSTYVYNYLINHLFRKYYQIKDLNPLLAKQISEVLKVKEIIEETTGLLATSEEIATELDWKTKKVESILRLISLQEIESLEEYKKQVNDDGYQYEESEPSLIVDNLEDNLLKNDMKQEIMKQINSIPEKHAECLKLYFGLSGQPPMSMEQIGKIYGCTGKNIRHIIVKALRFLRHPRRVENLIDYYLSDTREEDILYDKPISNGLRKSRKKMKLYK